MKINTQTPSRKKKVLVAVMVIAVLVAVGAAAYFVFLKPSNPSRTANESAINYDKASDEQVKTGQDIKQNSVDGSDSKTSGSDQAASPEPQANGKGKVASTMTAANQNGETLQIRFDIGAVANSGTCSLTLTKGTQKVNRSAGVQALAGSSTCKGFDIPVSDLSTGTWQIALHYESDELIADTTGTTVVK